ncbi:MAG TPA: ABC transporter ATP-binding protein [Solirubrobacter sp.]|nr:ABC transporter ATP-binding protein [Solirubrobacter sp.]
MATHTTPAAPRVEIDGVAKHFANATGGRFMALQDVAFSIADREFVSIIGPSGCGKTTLLRVIGGLEFPDQGAVRIDGAEVRGPGRERAIVFQDFALLPWRSVLGNVVFPLEIRGDGKAERDRRAREAIRLVGLDGFEDYHPNMLSGGMQQRVGLARALAVEPEVLLMDEPFGALDAQTRRVLQDELLQIWERDRKTVVFVTHDMAEAVYLSDRVIVLAANPGRVEKVVDVPLPRPRTDDARRTPEFSGLVADIWDTLQGSAK